MVPRAWWRLTFLAKLRDQCLEAKEDIDDKVQMALLDKLSITAFVDSDHGHDKLTHRSITGLHWGQ
eukprot:12691406-Ditylum_brightwellii.AAC.2